jgi:hypothetical protein
MATTDDVRTVTMTQADFVNAVTSFLLTQNLVPCSPLTLTLLVDEAGYQGASPTTPVLTATWDISASPLAF